MTDRATTVDAALLLELARTSMPAGLVAEMNDDRIRLRDLAGLDAGRPWVGLCGLGWKECAPLRVDLIGGTIAGLTAVGAPELRLLDERDGRWLLRCSLGRLECSGAVRLHQECRRFPDGGDHHVRRFTGRFSAAITGAAGEVEACVDEDRVVLRSARIDLRSAVHEFDFDIEEKPRTWVKTYRAVLGMGIVRAKLERAINDRLAGSIPETALRSAGLRSIFSHNNLTYSHG